MMLKEEAVECSTRQTSSPLLLLVQRLELAADEVDPPHHGTGESELAGDRPLAHPRELHHELVPGERLTPHRGGGGGLLLLVRLLLRTHFCSNLLATSCVHRTSCGQKVLQSTLSCQAPISFL